MYIVFVDVAATVQICTGNRFSRAKNLRKRRIKFARKNAKQTVCSVPAMRGVFYADRKDKTPAYKSHQCLAGSPDDRDLPAVDAVSGIGRQ